MKVKRFIAILLAVVLVLGLIPLTSVGGGVAYADAYPRLTSFTIATNASIIAKSKNTSLGIAKNAVVATVNDMELIQESPETTDSGVKLGQIKIYYTSAYNAFGVGTKIKSDSFNFQLEDLGEGYIQDSISQINIGSDGTQEMVFYRDSSAVAYYYFVRLFHGSKQTDTTAPVLTLSGFSRSSDSAATILFSADEAGKYYYACGEVGSDPQVDTSGEGCEMTNGENTISLEGLSAGAKTIRIIAKDSLGNEMNTPFEITLPAYGDAEKSWPKIETFSFTNGQWAPTGAYDYGNNKAFTFTNENVTITNYETLGSVPDLEDTETEKHHLVGEIAINYGDAHVGITSGAYIRLKSNERSVTQSGSVYKVSQDDVALNTGVGCAKEFTVKINGIQHDYYYKVKVVGNDLLAQYPNTWTLNEAGDTFTFKPGRYLSNYANWDTGNQVVPTWGTTLDKTFLNFTNGSDTFTLTNSVGTTKEYTVKLEMPWQLSVPGDPGYNVSFIKSGDKVLAQNETLKNNKKYTLTKEVEPNSTVTMTIKPYGDNAGKVIDTITLTSADGKTTFSDSDIPITINGNTFSFAMPRKDVKVASVTFKEDTSPRYTITTTASKYRSDNGDMGTVKVTDVNGAGIGDAHAGNDITVTAAPVEHGGYTFEFVGWEAKGITLTDKQKTSDTITFEMPADNVSLNAVFEKVGAELTFSADPENALKLLQPLSNTQKSPMSLDFSTTKKDIVKPGATIRVWPIENDQFVLESYTIKDQDNATIKYTSEGTWCEFTVPENATSVHVTANYRAKEFSEITTAVNDKTMGSVTATVNGTPISAAVTEGETVTLTATPKFRYKFDNWTVTYADGSKIDFGLTSAEGTPNVATFKVPANGKKIYITANFVRDKTQNSAECEMHSVGLYNGETKIGKLSKSGTNYTITVPADTDTSKLGEMLLKLTCSDHATVKKFGEKDPWPAEGKACGMELDALTVFVVTAEDGTTEKAYTITIKQEAAPNAPTLSAGSAERTSKTSATVTFTSSEAGMYFYSVVADNAAAPDIATTGSGTAAGAGSNTITLTNLTEDARDIYIVVKNVSGVESTPLKVDIPAYGDSTVPDTGAYSITYSGPKGGKLVPSRTKANEGDTITVTAVPDSGYQMVAGSMTYTLAVSGGTTTKITGNQFTMPEGDVTLSCQWETATATTTSGITAFTINGVSAAVNNTTNVITITLPRGTDVTKLTPVISTSGVKSLSPASGKTVDFTNSVTYTATMDDGSTKTYTVTVYVDKGSLADQFWDKLTDFYNQTPWWQYAEHQQSTKKYPKYW